MNTPRDATNFIRPLQVYAKPENKKIKKELVLKRTQDNILLDFMIILF
jgi:hypothetical protein